MRVTDSQFSKDMHAFEIYLAGRWGVWKKYVTSRKRHHKERGGFSISCDDCSQENSKHAVGICVSKRF